MEFTRESLLELTKKMFLTLPTHELEMVVQREKELIELLEEELRKRSNERLETV